MPHTTIESQGCTFAIQDSASPAVYQTVGNVVSITDLRGGNATVIDISNLASTRREKRMGLPDEGQITVQCQYDPDDTNGQVAMETARDSRTEESFQVSLSDSPATTFTFNGFVLTASLGVNIDDVVQATYTIEITGVVTKA